MTKRKNFGTDVDVADVESEVANAGAEVADLAAEVAALKKEVADLKEQIAKKPSGGLDPRIDKIVESLKLIFLEEGTYEERSIAHKKGKKLVEKI